MRNATLCILALLIVTGAAAQEDSVANARALAIAGQRLTALQMLEMHLLRNPADHDARTLYGTVLSWEGRFDDARQELGIVLRSDPRNLDARLALTRVEIWSGNRDAAEKLATESLILFPHDADLRTLRNQALSRDERSLLTLGMASDTYEDEDEWQETFLEYKRRIRLGGVVARAAHARRFGLDDDQFEIQFYPRIGRGGWASLALAYAPDASLYPEMRFSAEIHHAMGRRFEASAGVSYLDFRDASGKNVFSGSLSRYSGNYWFGGRLFTADGDTASQAFLRRFFGEHGQFVEVRAGKGTTRTEIRSTADLESLNTREIAVETLLARGERWTLRLRAGAGRTSERRERISMSAAVGRRF